MENEKMLEQITELAEEALQIIDDRDFGSLQNVLEDTDTIIHQLLEANREA